MQILPTHKTGASTKEAFTIPPLTLLPHTELPLSLRETPQPKSVLGNPERSNEEGLFRLQWRRETLLNCIRDAEKAILFASTTNRSSLRDRNDIFFCYSLLTRNDVALHACGVGSQLFRIR